MRTLIILGSTGSVGTQALDVVRRNPDRFRIVGLSSAQNHDLLIGQIREFMPPIMAVADEDAGPAVTVPLATAFAPGDGAARADRHVPAWPYCGGTTGGTRCTR